VKSSTFIVVYDVILFVASAVVFLMIVNIWRWRRDPGVKALIVMNIGQGFWTLCYALQLSDFIRPEPYFWSKLMFLGVVMVPASVLVWSSFYTRRNTWVNRRNISLLFLEPIIFNVIIWTDPWHKLFSGNYSQTGMLGIAFWVHSLYSYILLITGGMFLFLNWLQVAPAHKTQALLAMIALPIATLANAVTIFGMIPLKGIDFSPIGFVAASLIYTYAQLSHRLFDLLPIARDKVIDAMRDGVLVLDSENRIIDINPAAQEILQTNIKATMGDHVKTILPVWPQIEGNLDPKRPFHLEFLMEDAEKRTINLNITTLLDKQSQPSGKLIILRDITEMKTIENALRKTNQSLQQKIEEIETLQNKLREQAIRDPLTGLYNRRFMEETLNRELAQAARANVILSVSLIDLDHFKKINDNYGHSVGDLFLTTLGSMLIKVTRTGDVACRFGGEEFILIMPGATPDLAYQRVDELRQSFSKTKIPIGKENLTATFSAGVAGYPRHGTDSKSLLEAVDLAMYAAKQSGRNRVFVA